MGEKKLYFMGLLSLFIILPLLAYADMTKIKIISPAEFTPHSLHHGFLYNMNEFCIRAPGEYPIDYWIAPVDLPHGSRITKVKIYYWEEHSTKAFDVKMFRTRVSTSGTGGGTIFSYTTLGSGPGIKEAVITDLNYNIVRAKGYHYWFYVELDEWEHMELEDVLKERIYQIKIYYFEPQ